MDNVSGYDLLRGSPFKPFLDAQFFFVHLLGFLSSARKKCMLSYINGLADYTQPLFLSLFDGLQIFLSDFNKFFGSPRSFPTYHNQIVDVPHW